MALCFYYNFKRLLEDLHQISTYSLGDECLTTWLKLLTSPDM